MQPKRGRDPRAIPRRLEEPHVLRDAGARFVDAVTVGHFVTQHRPQPGLIHRSRDHVQAAVDKIRAGVVIDQRRGAVFDGVDQADLRAEPHRCFVQ